MDAIRQPEAPERRGSIAAQDRHPRRADGAAQTSRRADRAASVPPRVRVDEGESTMTSEPTPRLQLYEELLRRLASGVRSTQLYARITRCSRETSTGSSPRSSSAAAKRRRSRSASSTTSSSSRTRRCRRPARHEGIDRAARANGIERITFERGVSAEEIIGFIDAHLGADDEEPAQPGSAWGFPHIKVGQMAADERRKERHRRGHGGDPRLYRARSRPPRPPGKARPPRANPTCRRRCRRSKGSRDAVTQNRTALVALTAMRNYDNYTFTHMVNVSILTMGQAQALGIEGRLLREFGLSALMHDIGKVRTPQEILNKPEKLTDDEFVDHAAAPGRRGGDPPARRPRCRSSRRSSPSNITCGSTAAATRRRRSGRPQPRHHALQHRRRLRRDAVAARVSEGVPVRTRARGPAKG